MKRRGTIKVDGGRVAGIVTHRDLFIALGTNNRSAGDLPVGALMEKELSTCAPGDEIRSALKKSPRQAASTIEW